MQKNERAKKKKKQIHSNAMKGLKRERDLGVLVDGGDEIGEEIEAKKWLR